ncbi:hypothetical protein [Serratia phage SMP]|uniref:Uncharacterized protein n=1 Tax=Serratia phage SMP TaxID=2982904 RepID=A0A9E8JXG4_9CAUD|nr:hypothetical protein [Serratia phage SMP]
MATPKKTAPTGRAVDIVNTAGNRAPISFDESCDVVERRVDLTTIQSDLKGNLMDLTAIRDVANNILQSLDSQRVPYYGSNVDTAEDRCGIIYELDDVARATNHALGDVKIILELIQKRITG